MQTNKEFFREFVRAGLFTSVVLGVFFAFLLTLPNFGDKPREKFRVVDQYGPCEVVRYTDDTNRWHYFLDCK